MKTKIAILFLLALFLTTGIYLGGFASFAQSGSRGDSNLNPLDRLYLLDNDAEELTAENNVSEGGVATPPKENNSVGDNSTGLVDLTKRTGNSSAGQSVGSADSSGGNLTSGVTGAGESEEEGAFLILDDAPLPDVIMILARQAGINYQLEPKILDGVPVDKPDGTVEIIPHPNISIRFENVTARQALEAVLRNHNLELVEDPDPQIDIYRIVLKDPEAKPPLLTKVVQLNYSDPVKMKELLDPMLKAEDARSSLIVNTRTSQLIFRATEKQIADVEKLIVDLDRPNKQVLIEANLLETSINPQSVKGIDWSGTLREQNVTFGNGLTSQESTTVTPGQSSTVALPGGRQVTQTPGSSTTTTRNTVLNPGVGGLSLNTGTGFKPSTAILNADGLSATLSFLNDDSDTKVVATPRTVTADNETATLSVTRAFPIFKVNPGSAQVSASAEVTYTNLGTVLEVTPRITANSNIAMQVKPEVSNIDSVDRQILNGSENTANIYAIRRMETRVTIPNTHTLVLGGLISDTKSNSSTKVPILGDIPGIGLLFRRDAKEQNRVNLLIFITPTIVTDLDFQRADSDFLSTKPEDLEKDEEENRRSAWDSGRPYDWRPKHKKKKDEEPDGDPVSEGEVDLYGDEDGEESSPK